MQVSEAWLSRYLQLAKLPKEIVAAYADPREIKEVHARTLKPFLSDPATRAEVYAAARDLASEEGDRDGASVLAALRTAAKSVGAKTRRAPGPLKTYKRADDDEGVVLRRKGKALTLEVPTTLTRKSVSDALRAFMEDHFPSKGR